MNRITNTSRKSNFMMMMMMIINNDSKSTTITNVKIAAEIAAGLEENIQ
jgi:hypothetical protein